MCKTNQKYQETKEKAEEIRRNEEEYSKYGKPGDPQPDLSTENLDKTA